MKYGVHLPNFGPLGDARTLAKLAKLAEDAGWNGFFIWDHINRPQVLNHVDPWIALAAIALNTSTISIGAHITPFPRRRPWKLAREAVSIDHLSNGRLIVGYGIGSGKVEEWDVFGEEIDPKVRGEMLDEGLEIFVGLCSGNPFSFTGKHYNVSETQFLAKPINPSGIPLWGGGYWPAKAPFVRAAKYDGVFPIFNNKNDEPGQMKEMIQFVLSHATETKAFDVAYMSAPLKPDQWAPSADLAAPIANAGATWWIEEFTPTHYGAAWEDEWPVDAFVDRIQHGPPRI